MGAGQLSAKDKSIIDRCTANVYREYMKQQYKGRPPTLREFYNELKKQPEPEAQSIALSLELFTSGSLNVFAHQSNIDVNSRILNFDLYDLGENLKPLGLLVMLDSILNRVIRNRQKGRYTHIYIDEIYLFFTTEYSASFLYKCWKRFRKYGGIVTGITQNVEECLRSDTARLMLANSEFLMLLIMRRRNRRELAKLLNISSTQMSYITNADAGHDC
jgi:type IV secretory pathway VirB4 component